MSNVNIKKPTENNDKMADTEENINRIIAPPTTTTTIQKTLLKSSPTTLNPNATTTATTPITTDWSRFSQWMHCLCVVTFDLNLGQALEYVYPPEFTPTEQEVSNICYMAFPDSNSGCMGDTKFHMRLRAMQRVQQQDNRISTTSTTMATAYNSDCAPALRVDQSHFWGFVYFRQKRDPNLPRGYFQKSFIIITRLPFFNLYYDVLTQLAPQYFCDGAAFVEAACQQINSEWPELQAGNSLNLPLFDCNYQITIPKGSSSRKTTTTAAATTNQLPADSRGVVMPSTSNTIMPFANKIIASVHEVELFHSVGFVIEHLYTLWELVLTAEPIIVVGTSPADCSHMVQTLVALIAPLEFCAEARPYFTIHDSEFKEYTQECAGKAPPNVILGVTNPFFVKLFKDWPHMLRLVDNQMNMQQQQIYQKNLRNSNSVTSFGSSAVGVGSSSHSAGIAVGGIIPFKVNTHGSGVNNSNSITGSIAANSNSNTSIISSDGSMSGLHTKYKPFLKKDKSLIKKVLLGMKTKRPEHVQTALIRRHLLELTQSFMIPLERYMASLMPLQKDISPFKSAPNANSFKLDDFLATLELSGPHLTSPVKGDWKGLYRRFFKSPNFRGWYESRHRELQLTLQDLQLQALSEANLEHWAQDKQEVEIIDMILKLKQKLNLYTDKARIDGIGMWNNSVGTREQIRAQIDCMKELLPPDLKNVVNI